MREQRQREIEHAGARSVSYNAAGLNLSGAPMASMGGVQQVQAFGDRLMGQTINASAAGLDGMMMALVGLKDHDAKTKAELDSEKAKLELENAIDEGMAAAPGSAKSIFGADGSTDIEKVRGLMSDYFEKLNAARPTYINHGLYQAWDESVQKAQELMPLKIQGRIAQQQLKNIRANAQQLLDLYSKQGDYGAARGVLQQGVQNGVYTEAEAAGLEYDLNENETLQSIGELAQSNPQGFLDRYENGEYDGGSWKAREAADRAADSIYRSMSGGAGVVTKDNKTGKLNKETPEAPAGVTRELYELWNARKGDFRDPDGQNAAMVHLRRWAEGMITEANNEDQAQRVTSMYKAYGLNEGYAGKVIQTLRRQISGLEYKPMDISKLPVGALFRQENADSMKRWQARLDVLKSLPEPDEEEKAERKELEAKIQKWHGYDKAAKERAAMEIGTSYNAWREQNPEADYSTCAQRYAMILNDYMRAAKVAPGSMLNDAMAAELGLAQRMGSEIYARKAQRAQKAEAVQKDTRQTAEARTKARETAMKEAEAKQAQKTRNLDLALAGDPTATLGLPGNAQKSIIYVPKDSGLTDGETLRVKYGRAERDAKVVQVEGLQAPAISRMLAAGMGVRASGIGSVKITGNTAELVDGVDDGLLSGQGLFPEDETVEEAVPMSEAAEEKQEEQEDKQEDKQEE